MFASLTPAALVVLVLGGALLAAPGARAETWCVPFDTSARILQSPDAGDLHPDWQDGSTVGLSWSLLPLAWMEGDQVYIEGDLYGPDGGLVNGLVVVLADEWDCADY